MQSLTVFNSLCVDYCDAFLTFMVSLICSPQSHCFSEKTYAWLHMIRFVQAVI